MPGNKWMVREIIRVIGPSIAYVPLTKGLFSLIDSEDADEVGKYNWRAAYRPLSRCDYATRSIRKEGGGHIDQALQEFLLGRVEGMQVDHIHGKSLDNRRSQLRHATPTQQKMNQPTYRNNTTGHKGVYWRERDQQWSAAIGFEKKLIHLGQFDCMIDAIAAREAAEKHYFGAFSRMIK